MLDCEGWLHLPEIVHRQSHRRGEREHHQYRHRLDERVPTIATMVPRLHVVTARFGRSLIPLVTRTGSTCPAWPRKCSSATPHGVDGRPFLADPDWVRKAEAHTPERINTCIACNQACLDLIFQNKRASCMVNPLACYETEVSLEPTTAPKSIAVVGAGPAGLAFSTAAAERGHAVTLFDGAAEIGGQFNMAKRIPGKEEFYETLRYFSVRLAETRVDLRLNTRVDADALSEGTTWLCWPRGSPSPTRFARNRPPIGAGYLDAEKRCRRRQAGGADRRGRHRLRRGRVPHPSRRIVQPHRRVPGRVGGDRRMESAEG